MATCAECGTQISERETLFCSECQRDFCREHYHGHDCDSTYEITDVNETKLEQQSGKEESGSSLSLIVYGVALLSAAIGSIYFLSGVGVVFFGGGIRELSSLTIGGAFYSLATFLLVGGYILGQSGD